MGRKKQKQGDVQKPKLSSGDHQKDLSGPHRLDEAGNPPGYATLVCIHSVNFDGEQSGVLARSIARGYESRGIPAKIAPHLRHAA